VEAIYRQLGGRVSVMIKDGQGHHPHSLRDPKPIADFVEQSAKPEQTKAPEFLGKTFTRSSYYGAQCSYRDFPTEKTHVTCRGPWFVPCYDRYESKVAGVRPSVTVIVPRKSAKGTPWVFRADLVGPDSAVDQALLARGFHVVTGPVPYDADGPILKEWQAVYKHLVGHGFSKKPVLAGAGGAGGEAYGWAAENPDKAACVYCENPILRGHLSKKPVLDNLAGMAKAGIPAYHACGSLDPWLKSQTRAAEERYKKLGGKVTVAVKPGEGHYPLAPKDLDAVVDFIVQATD
jgi:hypothetical protein